MYEDRWCARCAHHEDCAVWYLHFAHNGEKDKAEMLDALIPRSEDGLSNEQCRMFVTAPEPTSTEPHCPQILVTWPGGEKP